MKDTQKGCVWLSRLDSNQCNNGVKARCLTAWRLDNISRPSVRTVKRLSALSRIFTVQLTAAGCEKQQKTHSDHGGKGRLTPTMQKGSLGVEYRTRTYKFSVDIPERVSVTPVQHRGRIDRPRRYIYIISYNYLFVNRRNIQTWGPKYVSFILTVILYHRREDHNYRRFQQRIALSNCALLKIAALHII